MQRQFLSWLLAGLLCAACMAGQPPAPLTRAAATTAAAASPTEAATGVATGEFAPATPPLTTDVVEPTVAAGATLTPVVGLITPATAISVTQLALVDSGKVDQAAWSPGGERLAAARSEET